MGPYFRKNCMVVNGEGQIVSLILFEICNESHICQFVRKLMNYKMVKILNYKDYSAKSHVVDGHQNHNLNMLVLYISLLTKLTNYPFTAVVNIARFTVTSISFSTFPVSSWQPCWRWCRMMKEKTRWYFT